MASLGESERSTLRGAIRRMDTAGATTFLTLEEERVVVPVRRR
jgi:hypothetical protein